MSEDSRDEGKIARAPDSGIDDPTRTRPPPSGDDDPWRDRAPQSGGHVPRTRSGWWYLVPILFGIIGGVIVFFVIRHDDPPKAKNCIYIGIALTVLMVVVQGSVPPF